MASSFKNEVHRTVNSMHADAWVVPSGSSGPFTAASAFPASTARAVAAEPGVRTASAIVVLRFTVRIPTLHDINAIGVEIGGVGSPDPAKGHALRQSGDVVVDSKLGPKVGDTLVIASRPFHVVGVTHGITFLAGTPTVFLPLQDAQAIALGNQPLATSIAT